MSGGIRDFETAISDRRYRPLLRGGVGGCYVRSWGAPNGRLPNAETIPAQGRAKVTQARPDAGIRRGTSAPYCASSLIRFAGASFTLARTAPCNPV